MSMPWSALAILAGYLIGSLSFAVIVSRAMGLADPRTYGSKNAGATNVLRSGSKAAAVITLLLDAAKGVAAVLLTLHVLPQLTHTTQPPELPALVGLAAFIGHVWPVWFRFQGGKGVATAVGVLAALDPVLAVATVAVWLAVVAVSRIVSLASIVAALAAPFMQLLVWGTDENTLPLLLMSLLLLWRHFPNVQRLFARTEPRLGGAKPLGVPAGADAGARGKAPQPRHSHSHRKAKKGH